MGTYAYDPAAGYLGRDLKGIVLLFSRSRVDVSPENPLSDGVRAYFGDDTSMHEKRSPMMHATASSLPVMVAIAEFDNPLLDLYGLELAHRIALARHDSFACPDTITSRSWLASIPPRKTSVAKSWTSHAAWSDPDRRLPFRVNGPSSVSN